MNVFIPFYSRGGATEALAKAVAEGALAAGAAVRLRRAREIVGPEVMGRVPGWLEQAERMNAEYPAPTEDDAKWADAMILGWPTRFGLMSSELKAYVDSLGGLWMRGKLNLKVGSSFTSTSTVHGGSEVTNLTMFVPMIHFGMIIVPPGFGDPVMFRAGTPYGASAHSAKVPPQLPGQDALDAARYQGERVARVAQALVSLRAAGN